MVKTAATSPARAVDEPQDSTDGQNRARLRPHPNVPLQHQIFMQLQGEIRDGLWLGDGGFPGEREIAERFGVSVVTSRAALQRLADEGLLIRGRGLRSRAVMPPLPAPLARAPASELVANARFRPFEYRLLEAGVKPVPALACMALGEAPGTPLWSCSRLRMFEGRSHSITLNVQLPAIGLRHTQRQLQTLPMAEMLRAQGITFAKMTRQVAAGHPVPLVAEHLHMTINDPTLIYTVTMYADTDQPVEWVRIFVHPDETIPLDTFDLKTGRWDLEAAM